MENMLRKEMEAEEGELYILSNSEKLHVLQTSMAWALEITTIADKNSVKKMYIA